MSKTNKKKIDKIAGLSATTVHHDEMKEPFTEKEEEVCELLIQAHNKFIKLERTHPSELSEWLLFFHSLQALMGARVLRRDYPKTFYCGKEVKYEPNQQEKG